MSHFDKHKNWIKKTYSKENKTNQIIERQIEYCEEKNIYNRHFELAGI
jgi:hypothetical protein